MESILTTENLYKKYRQSQVLNGLSLRVPKGSVYGLVGKNGAGKTTLIRLICGLQEPTDGSYTLYDTKHTEPDIIGSRRKMGAVVESPAFYSHMTAEQNLKEQYRILGLPSHDGIPELLKMVGLEEAGKKKVRNFSLGMRQRLGIAMALAREPDFLVLDEPMNGLDPQGIVEMRELLLRLNRERQITILISSHILDELSRLATHYGVIDQGRMIKEFTAEELEAVCHKCIRVTVTKQESLIRILNDWKMEYRVVSDKEIDIFDSINITRLALTLWEDGCEILRIQEKEESLENYYFSLIGGNRCE